MPRGREPCLRSPAITDWIVRLIDQGGYLGIALLMVLENVFPPIPSEVIMGIGGIRVAQGRMDPTALMIAGTTGTTIGNYFWYVVGRTVGLGRLRSFVARWGRWLTLDWPTTEKLCRLFKRYGGTIVFVFRFLPTFRTMVSLPAGLFRMGSLRFLAWTAAGSAIWNAMLVLAGYLLGTHFAEIDRYIGPATTVIVVIALGAFAWRYLTWKPLPDTELIP